MKDDRLDLYVQSERARGVSNGALSNELLHKGWNKKDVDQVLYGIKEKERLTIEGFTLARLLVGRINRGQFLFCFVSAALFALVVASIFGLVIRLLNVEVYDNSSMAVIFVIVISLFLYWISCMVRRLHDTGLSGYYVLGIFIPVVNIITIPLTIAYLMITEGQPKTNVYGLSPDKERNLINVLINTGTEK